MSFGATATPPVNAARAAAVNETTTVGKQMNKLRMDALEADMPFVAGIIRGAEESVLCAVTMLNDPSVKDEEL